MILVKYSPSELDSYIFETRQYINIFKLRAKSNVILVSKHNGMLRNLTYTLSLESQWEHPLL